jgi:hypothetical protein
VELRADVDAMAEAVRDALVGSLPRDSIRAISFTGSAAKDWTSPVDYVPELSDVDIHVWLEDGSHDAWRGLHDLALGLRRHEVVAQVFSARRPVRSHTPRVQVILHNDLLRLDGYLPAPRGTVRTLHGEQYQFARAEEVADARVVDARALVTAADEDVLQVAIADLIERPGRHGYYLLAGLSWRLSPLASRVLSVRGVSYERAWGTNRTARLQQLNEVGVRRAGHLLHVGVALASFRVGSCQPRRVRGGGSSVTTRPRGRRGARPRRFVAAGLTGTA